MNAVWIRLKDSQSTTQRKNIAKTGKSFSSTKWPRIVKDIPARDMSTTFAVCIDTSTSHLITWYKTLTLNALTITNISAAEAIGLKMDLDRGGLVVEQDYTWRFQPVKYTDGFSATPMSESQVVFEFTDPAMASFYKLKWA